MPAWSSPFPLAQSSVHQLLQSGWEESVSDSCDFPDDCVFIYEPPDRLLSLDLSTLISGYQELLGRASGSRVVALWRLIRLEHPPKPPALAAALTQSILAVEPKLLDLYLDLELKADLLGGEPDVAYRRRLIDSLDFAELQVAWQELDDLRVAQSAVAIAHQDALAEQELLLRQMQQQRKEYEQLFLADQQKEGQLRKLKNQLGELRDELIVKEASQREAREEAELTLLQLHQVQEELEKIFLDDRQKGDRLRGLNVQLNNLRDELKVKQKSEAEIGKQRDNALQELRRAKSKIEKYSLEVTKSVERQQVLETQLKRLREEVKVAKASERDVREALHLKQLQLGQVEEELTHYFHLSSARGRQIERYSDLQLRSQRLLARLAMISESKSC